MLTSTSDEQAHLVCLDVHFGCASVIVQVSNFVWRQIGQGGDVQCMPGLTTSRDPAEDNGFGWHSQRELRW